MATRNITHADTEWVTPFILAVVLILAGVLLILYKRSALVTILMIVGVLLFVLGLIGLVLTLKNSREFPIFSLIELVIGVVLFVVPGFVSDFMMVLIGIALIIYGGLTIMGSLATDVADNVRRIVSLLIGAIALIIGIYALLNLNSTADVVMIIIGAVTLILGVLQAVSAYRLYTAFHS